MRPALEQLKDRHNLVGVEIGVFHGDYALIYLKELDIKRVFLIDPYIKYDDWDECSLKEAEKDAHTKLDIYKNKIRWMKAKSSEAVEVFDDESFDFVYIDGDHQYEFALQDITLYYPKVKKGGLLSGHDYRPKKKERVFRAVNEFYKRNNLKLNLGELDWWIWK